MGKTKSVTSFGSSHFSFSSDGASIMGKLRNTWDTWSMGVLYSVVHGDNVFTRTLFIVYLCIEFIQMLHFAFREMFPWHSGLKYFGLVLSTISFPQQLLTYSVFGYLYWVIFLYVWIVFLNTGLVVYSFYSEAVRFAWPVRTLRWLASQITTTLYIPVLLILFTPLACVSDFDATDDISFMRMTIFPTEGSYFDATKGFSIYNPALGSGTPCWDKRNLSKYVASIITLILFLVFSIVFSLGYFSQTPPYYGGASNSRSNTPTRKVKTREGWSNNDKASEHWGRAHSRHELILLVVKLFWCCSFQLLGTTQVILPHIIAIFMILGSSVALGASLVWMPFYSKKLNKLRTIFLSIILYASIMALLCSSINNPNELVSTYAFVVGIIPSAVAGYMACVWRQKSFFKIAKAMSSTPVTTASFTTTTTRDDTYSKNVSSSVFNKTKSTEVVKGVRWAPENLTAASWKKVPQEVIDSFRFTTDVEIATRFVIEDNIVANKESALVLAESLYRAGLRKFPRSSFVLMSYINFLIYYKREHQRGFALLDKLRKLTNPYYDVRFFLFKQDKEREKQIHLEGIDLLEGAHGTGQTFHNFVGYMSFRKLYAQAHNAHRATNKLVRKFWSTLLEENVDMSALADQAGKISVVSERAENSYKTLLNLYPNSPRLLRDFAQFVDDIMHEDELVKMLVDRADHLEDTACKSKSRTPRGNGEDEYSDDDDEYQDDDEELGLGAASKSSISEDISRSSEFQKKKKEFLRRKNINHLTSLHWVAFFTTVLSIVIMLTMMAIIVPQLQECSNNMQKVTCVAAVNQLGTDITVNARMGLVAGMANDTKAITDQMSQLGRRGNVIRNTVQAILWGQKDLTPFYSRHYKQIANTYTTTLDIAPRHFSFYDYNTTGMSLDPELAKVFYEPSLPVTITMFEGTRVAEEIIYMWGLWSLVSQVASVALTLGALPAYAAASLAHSTDWWFVMKNGPKGLSEGLRELLIAQKAVSLSGLTNMVNTSYIIYGVIVAITIVTAVVTFRPAVNKLLTQKIETLSLFLLVPEHVVQKMSAKVVHLHNIMEDASHSNIDQERKNDFDDETNNDCNTKNDENIITIDINSSNEIEMQEKEKLIDGNDQKRNERREKARFQSMRNGFRSLHWSYSVAIFFTIFCYSMFIVATKVTSNTLIPSYDAIYITSERARLVGLARALAVELRYNVPERNATRELMKTVTDDLLALQHSCELLLVGKHYEQILSDSMYGAGCLRINSSACYPPTHRWYSRISHGEQHMMQEFVFALTRMRQLPDSYIEPNVTNDDYNFIYDITLNDLYDAVERMMWRVSTHWLAKLKTTQDICSGLASAIIFIFLLEYFAFFRPLLRRLDNESKNTLVMLHMIPKNELAGVRELKELFEDF